MRPNLDLSIGQRLAIGLAMLLFVFVAVLLAVVRAHDASARAQATFTQHRAPLSEQAFALERSVYEVGLATRAYLLSPGDSSLAEYRRVASVARDRLKALHDVSKPPISEALYSELAPLLLIYLVEADRVIEDRPSSGDSRVERSLVSARDRALVSLRTFTDYQADRARAALSAMASARESVTRDLALACALALLLFVLLAFLTAESIRRPAAELVRVARGFERGMWKAALPWAPDRTTGSDREPRSEMLKIARALGAAAAALERREQRLYADANLAAAAASSLEKQEIGRAIQEAVVSHVDGAAAVMYLLEPGTQLLVPIAQYGLSTKLSPVHLGEGLPGEAAKLGRPLVLQNVAAEAPFTIHVGAARITPRAVVAVPIASAGSAIGAMVVASMSEMESDKIALLTLGAHHAAGGLRNALMHEEIQRLLGELGESERRAGTQAAHEQTAPRDSTHG